MRLRFQKTDQFGHIIIFFQERDRPDGDPGMGLLIHAKLLSWERKPDGVSSQYLGKMAGVRAAEPSAHPPFPFLLR
jgi:hypothetical protein